MAAELAKKNKPINMLRITDCDLEYDIRVLNQMLG